VCDFFWTATPSNRNQIKNPFALLDFSLSEQTGEKTQDPGFFAGRPQNLHWGEVSASLIGIGFCKT
jgi:hypothetical protein